MGSIYLLCLTCRLRRLTVWRLICLGGFILFSNYRVCVDFSARLYMDGWRDGLNRLWRDGVTVLTRPAKKISTAKNNRPVPALEKKKHRPVPSRRKKKKKPPRPASEKNNNRPVPPRKKKKTAPSRHEQQNTPPRGWKLETNTTAYLFFSLSCCTFISYCSLVRSSF